MPNVPMNQHLVAGDDVADGPRPAPSAPEGNASPHAAGKPGSPGRKRSRTSRASGPSISAPPGGSDVLDDRKAAILRSVVTEYIDTAQPVGSSHVVRSAGLSVSAATVRNEMSALEDEGFLVQPHTSAGRVPTDKGYRFFVDHLPEGATLIPGEMEQVRSFFARTHGELEALLHDTSDLLSKLTRYAAVVIGSVHDSALIRTAQIVWLGDRSVLALFVLSDGGVEKIVVEMPVTVSEHDAEVASRVLAEQSVGRSLGEIPVRAASARRTDSVADRIVDAALASVGSSSRGPDSEQIYVGGAARMASAFDAIETVRCVLSILEQQYMVVSLLKNVLDHKDAVRDPSVAIGAEHGLVSLADCSVVVAPFHVSGREVGAIGVLGPTRMHYEQAMAAVAVVGNHLGSRLTAAPG